MQSHHPLTPFVLPAAPQRLLPFAQAVLRGDLAGVQTALADSNAARPNDAFGLPPGPRQPALNHAIERGHTEVALALLSAGASPMATHPDGLCRPPVERAIAIGNRVVFEYMALRWNLYSPDTVLPRGSLCGAQEPAAEPRSVWGLLLENGRQEWIDSCIAHLSRDGAWKGLDHHQARRLLAEAAETLSPAALTWIKKQVSDVGRLARDAIRTACARLDKEPSPERARRAHRTMFWARRHHRGASAHPEDALLILAEHPLPYADALDHWTRKSEPIDVLDTAIQRSGLELNAAAFRRLCAVRARRRDSVQPPLRLLVNRPLSLPGVWPRPSPNTSPMGHWCAAVLATLATRPSSDSCAMEFLDAWKSQPAWCPATLDQRVDGLRAYLDTEKTVPAGPLATAVLGWLLEGTQHNPLPAERVDAARAHSGQPLSDLLHATAPDVHRRWRLAAFAGIPAPKLSPRTRI